MQIAANMGQGISVPQIHLTGGRDSVVPPRVLDSWLAELQPLPSWIRRIVAPDAGHQGPWLQAWRLAHTALMEQPRAG